MIILTAYNPETDNNTETFQFQDVNQAYEARNELRSEGYFVDIEDTELQTAH